MKKVLLLSMLSLSCLFMTSNVYAHNSPDNLVFKEEAVLIGDSGKRVAIEPIEVSDPKPILSLESVDSQNQVYCKEAVFEITPQDFGNAGSMQDIKWDSTGGVKAWVKIYYGYSNGGILLNAVEVNWRKDDPHLSLSNANIMAWCQGVNYYNGQPVKNQRTWYVSPSHIKKYTGFTTPVKTTPGAWVAGKSNVTIKRGGSSWELNLPVNIYMG